MSDLGWGGGDGRPSKKQCPVCGKSVRGLKQHRKAVHRRPKMDAAAGCGYDDLEYMDGMFEDRERES